MTSIQIKYVCVATELKLYLPYLKQLLPDLVILGLNTPWQGFITKYKLLEEYLSQKEIQDDDVICFIDAYDVLPTKHRAALAANYHAFIKDNPEVKIIVGYDKVDNFIHEYFCQVIFGTLDEKGQRLNSGQFIGTAKNIREIITYILDNTAEFKTDQIELTKYANQFKNQVHIDEAQAFFYVKSRPLQQVLNTNKTNKACFIHANGNGFLDRFLLEEHDILVEFVERWQIRIDNVKGVLKKIIIYDMIYIERVFLAFRDFLLDLFIRRRRI